MVKSCVNQITLNHGLHAANVGGHWPWNFYQKGGARMLQDLHIKGSTGEKESFPRVLYIRDGITGVVEMYVRAADPSNSPAKRGGVDAVVNPQHTQPAKCRDCYHWAVATSARCVRGGGDQCVIKGGTQQASA